jgi:hypothetical protein
MGSVDMLQLVIFAHPMKRPTELRVPPRDRFENGDVHDVELTDYRYGGRYG